MHLLLAEDDKISRDLLRRIIESEGHTVTVAHDGEEAWALLLKRETHFDGCIFDICMPQVSGLELVEKMRGNDLLKRIPIVLCTAVHDRATVQKAAALGVCHYVLKPYSRSVMLEKLRQIRGARQEDGAAMEEPAAVCSRLGIEPEFHREMVSTVLQEATGFIAEIRGDRPDLPKLFIRARGLNGSCLTFGLKRAASRLDQVEAVIEPMIAAKDTSAMDKLRHLVADFERGLAPVKEWSAPPATSAPPAASVAPATAA